jgi:hypothetical protein
VCDASIGSASVSFGFGRHIYDIDPKNLPTIGLLGQFQASAATLATLWSKTSFGITLLRITKGFSKGVVWFLIITMNLALSLNVLFTWIQCTPIQKAWNVTTDGTCWDPRVNVYYGVASASECELFSVFQLRAGRSLTPLKV